VIYGFGSSDIYVVLECLDCDLREYLDRHHNNLPLATIKVGPGGSSSSCSSRWHGSQQTQA
jgi:hypothetical protein